MLPESFGAKVSELSHNLSARSACVSKISSRLRRCRLAVCSPGARLAADAELEVEVADVQGEAEPAEVMDDQRGEDDQQDRHEEPEQPPEEGRHTASYAHGR